MCLCITDSNKGGREKGSFTHLAFIYIGLRNPITACCPDTDSAFPSPQTWLTGRNSIFVIFKNGSIQAAMVLCFPPKGCSFLLLHVDVLEFRHLAPAGFEQKHFPVCLFDTHGQREWRDHKEASLVIRVWTRQLRRPSLLQMRLRRRCELRKTTCITAAGEQFWFLLYIYIYI